MIISQKNKMKITQCIFCKIFIVLFLTSLGCSTSGKKTDLTAITIGMTKQQVIALKGKPSGVSAKNGVEYLFCRGVGWNVETGLEDEKVSVRFKDGLVDSYGPSTELDNATNINLNVTN